MLRATAVMAGLWCLTAVTALAHDPPAKQAAGAQVLTAAERAPASVVDRFHAALERGDTTAALALMADDVLVFEQGGAERSKAEYAGHHAAADAEFARATESLFSGRRVQLSGNMALVTTETRTTGRFRDRDVNSAGVETMVLRRSRDGWRIVHIHWSSGKTGGDGPSAP